MSDHDERADRPAPGAPEQNPERLLPDHTQKDPERLLTEGAHGDPSKLLPSHAGEHAWEHVHEHPHAYPPHHPAHRARHTARWLAALLALVGIYAAGMAIHDKAQERQYYADRAARMTGGDPARGPALIRSYGCAQCHTVPGVAGANGLVGPPLAGIASRVYIGGVITNTPEHMVRWIMNPKAIDPKTAMPYLGVTDDQARHIAAYLYTLR